MCFETFVHDGTPFTPDVLTVHQPRVLYECRLPGIRKYNRSLLLASVQDSRLVLIPEPHRDIAMSYLSVELFDSRKISAGTDQKSIALRFLIYGGDDASEVDAYNFVCDPSGNDQGLAPYVMDGLNRSDVKLNNIAGPGGIWVVDVAYGSQPIIACVDQIDTFNQYGGLSAARGPEFQADTSGKSLHITQSLATRFLIQGGAGGDVLASGTNATINLTGSSVTLDGTIPTIPTGSTIVFSPAQGWNAGSYITSSQSGSVIGLDRAPGDAEVTGGIWVCYGPNVASSGGSATNLSQAIGVTTDGVQGTDIIVPSLEFTVSGVVAPFNMQTLFVWYPLVGTINQDVFWGFNQGEVLYQGSTVQTTDGKQFRITHKFVAQPSAYNVTITPTLIIPFKQGWDYLWVYYSPGTAGSGANMRPTQLPVAGYVEQVYPYGDFSQLMLG